MESKVLKLYKQEGKFGTYQIMLPAVACSQPILKYLPASYGDLWVFIKNNYGLVFMQEDRMEQVAKSFIELANDSFPPGWQEHWQDIDHKITQAARQISHLDLSSLSAKDLEEKYLELFSLAEDMWAISIFIDTLDAGYDQVAIERIATERGLSPHEVQVLLAPSAPSYIAQWESALLAVKHGDMSLEQLEDKFFWYKTDYTEFGELDEQFINSHMAEAKPSDFISPEEEQQTILQQHNLSANPLETFRILANWRDDRKRLHFTSLYGLMRLIREGLKRLQIEQDLANSLLSIEVKDMFQGHIDGATLQSRHNGELMVHILENGTYLVKEDNEAIEELQQLQQFLPKTEVEEVKGMIACKGEAQGTARVIFKVNGPEAEAMQPGDILITSMTRPEFVPLMRKAAAIVTDEGGISCHAAIVSRELGIPCIIGTKIATKVFATGDQVKVDALQGIAQKVGA